MAFWCSNIWHYKMDRLSPTRPLQVIQLYYENERSTRNVYHALRATYGPHNRPTERIIHYTIDKFQLQFLIMDNTRPHRPHPARGEGNIAAVAVSVHEAREASIHRRSQQLGLSYQQLGVFYERILV